ncbi:MAG: hypothetical protein DYG94_00195 [Leptolyngbya sp. PLA3]|nr:MAG: hypothetical protein EDM82_01680 [Cyanobacteria bacterium CYA]MCE7967155.1 hypothetical protein [Leptolyngbya sp. PL-A3]
MKMVMVYIAAVSLASSAGLVGADTPRMGGPMKHIMVTYDDMMQTLMAHVDDSVPTPELKNYGETYDAPADVLNGTWYNAQYGWMIEGFWAPPGSSQLWIEQVSATPGLAVYSGGTMMHMGTFTPICGTDGSRPAFTWSGSMLHNWYAVTRGGPFSATYRVYFGDVNGVPLEGYGAGEVTLNWISTAPDCPADMVEPWGVLDFFDVQAFLGAFSAGLPEADLVEPFGVFDFFDVQAFLNSFSAGCP